MKYVIKWCPICDQGWILLVKETLSGKLFYCCQECEEEWNIQSDITDSNYLPSNTYGKYEYPTINEVKESGLDKNIIKIIE